MDLSCIISSGDLELYVLGMLPEDEAYKIKQLALLFPEIKEEIDRIAQTLEDFADTAAVEPSPRVKENLMNKLKDLKNEEGAKVYPIVNEAAAKDETSTGKETTSETPVVPITKAKRPNRFLTAAAIIGAVVGIGFIVDLLSQNHKYQNEVATLNNRVQTLNQSYQQQQQQLNNYAQSNSIMLDTNYRKISMPNVPGKPQALAQVFWNKRSHEVFVADVSLPAPPAGKQYQLWAIVDGKPVDAGMLSDVKQQVQRMKDFPKADAFAITLERQGGSPTPTMTAMYVMGKVS